MGSPGRVAVALALACCACSIETSGLSPEIAADANRLDASSPRDAPVTDAGAPPEDAVVPPIDAGPTDAGTPLDFRDLDWSPPEPLSGVSDPDRCETDPVVTSDMRWLFVSRPAATGTDCYLDREFHAFRWNDGAPTYAARIGRFDPTREESNPHPLDGAFAGRAGDILFYFSAGVAALGREIMYVWLTGAPPAPEGSGMPITALSSVGSDSDPAMTLGGDAIVFARDGDLFVASGTPPAAYGEPSPMGALSTGQQEMDPALSTDGRVIVFARRGTGSADLWVARRDDPAAPFPAATRLSSGAGEINTDPNDEMDPFITAEGDLVYMSTRRSSIPRLFIARRFVP